MANGESTTDALVFTPSAFVEQVTAAVLPLIDYKRCTVLREGKTRADVLEAASALFGHYKWKTLCMRIGCCGKTDHHWTPRVNP